MLATGLQAEANSNTQNWGTPFIEIAIKNNIDIYTLPCTESQFYGMDIGLARKKHGIDYYSSLPKYKQFCREKAMEASAYIQAFEKSNHILAIVGVEHSPSCAINYMYSRHGMLKESGLFMRYLKYYLLEKQVKIPFIGVNRKYPKKSLLELTDRIQDKISERERVTNDHNI